LKEALGNSLDIEEIQIFRGSSYKLELNIQRSWLKLGTMDKNKSGDPLCSLNHEDYCKGFLGYGISNPVIAHLF
jgi:hypothetical protein